MSSAKPTISLVAFELLQKRFFKVNKMDREAYFDEITDQLLGEQYDKVVFWDSKLSH